MSDAAETDAVGNPLQSPVANMEIGERESKASAIAESESTTDDESVNLEAALMNKASMFSCYACLTNTIMGGGILGLPFAFANTGWSIGMLLMILCGSSSVFSLHELSVCAALTEKPASFYSVAMKGTVNLILLLSRLIPFYRKICICL